MNTPVTKEITRWLTCSRELGQKRRIPSRRKNWDSKKVSPTKPRTDIFREFRLNRRAAIAVLSLAPLLDAASSAAERKKFIGMWKLTSGESKDQATGAVTYPW